MVVEAEWAHLAKDLMEVLREVVEVEAHSTSPQGLTAYKMAGMVVQEL
jgi:hypothetical protein